MIGTNQTAINSSLVVDSLLERASNPVNKNRICAAYVYCDYRDEANQTAVNLLSTLLKQVLAAYGDDIPAEIFDVLKERRKTSGGHLSLDEILRFLLLAPHHFEKSFICIDAFDECKVNEGKTFLRLIANLLDQPTHSTRIFLTGRPHVQATITKHFAGVPHVITLEANADGIRRYVAYQLEMDDNYDDMDDDFKKGIIEGIVETANGMLVLTYPKGTYFKVHRS
jgi:hypothetical protein